MTRTSVKTRDELLVPVSSIKNMYKGRKAVFYMYVEHIGEF